MLLLCQARWYFSLNQVLCRLLLYTTLSCRVLCNIVDSRTKCSNVVMCAHFKVWKCLDEISLLQPWCLRGIQHWSSSLFFSVEGFISKPNNTIVSRWWLPCNWWSSFRRAIGSVAEPRFVMQGNGLVDGLAHEHVVGSYVASSLQPVPCCHCWMASHCLECLELPWLCDQACISILLWIELLLVVDAGCAASSGLFYCNILLFQDVELQLL